MDDQRLYFRQLLSGRDLAVGDPLATQMVNFVYLVGDRDSGEAVAVDPAYAVDDVLAALAADDMRLTGVLATHHHPDHVGGAMIGYPIQGLAELLDREQVPVHVHRAEADWVTRVTGLSATDLTTHDSGDVLEVGAVNVQLLHTPGHTPGSQCFLVDNRLVAGDTLFLDGCGRTDLPGGDPADMYDSLQRLAALPDTVVLYPGHQYSAAPAAPLAEVRRSNYVFRPANREQWLTLFGAA